MEDIAGIGKIAESKLASQIYDEAGSAAVRELGGIAADLIKTLRLFTAPFQVAAVAQDRFQRWLDEARSRVPKERQVEAPSAIAGPALRAMLFMEEDNPMAQMFVNLLSQAIDKDTQPKVHPGFVSVLEQMIPDEALLLHKLHGKGLLGVQVLHLVGPGQAHKIKSLTTFPSDDFLDPDSISMYFEHLAGLCLVAHQTDIKTVPPKENPEWVHYRWYALTRFGVRFLDVCGQSHVANEKGRK
jgi:hypothetical protein